MGKHFIDSETERISYPDGNWVDVKSELTQEDQDYILNQMAKVEAAAPESENKGVNESKVTLSIGRLALLERSVVTWSFEEPVNRENLSRLRLKYRTKLLEEINRLNEEASEFVSKNASKAST